MTAATASGIERPPLKVSVRLADETDYEIRLTYGLFQDLQRSVASPDAIVDTMLSDPFTRDYVIRRCLTPTKKIITKPDEELISEDDVLLEDPDEINKLLQWVAGHMLYFFATSAGGLKRLGELFKGTTAPVTAPPAPSTAGSES